MRITYTKFVRNWDFGTNNLNLGTKLPAYQTGSKIINLRLILKRRAESER